MDDPAGSYFLTCTTVEWVDVFTRVAYKDIIIEALSYCVENKGLIVHAYVIMSNHVHLVISRTEDGQRFSDIVRDFKKFTAARLLKNIKSSRVESRRAWVLDIFQKNGLKNSNNKQYQFWQQHNKPILLYSSAVFRQKIDYIHNNPVRQGLVFNPSDYVYSSATAYEGRKLEAKLAIQLWEGYFSF